MRPARTETGIPSSVGRARRRYAPRCEAIERRLLLAAFSETTIPTPGAMPLGITQGPDGAVWFTENGLDQVGRIAPSDPSTVVQFGDMKLSGGKPTQITTGTDRNLWVTLPGTNQVAKITPKPFGVTVLPAKSSNSRPTGIAPGPDDALWFTEPGATKIGRVSTSGDVSEPGSPRANSNPTGIVQGSDLALWFTEQGTDSLGRIDPKTNTLSDSEVTFPAGSQPTNITAGPDGALWVALTGTSHIAQAFPGKGHAEYALTPGAAPVGITSGPDGNVWFVESGLGRIGRITTNGQITEFAAPSDAGQLSEITSAAGSLWITAPAANKILRLDPSQLLVVTANPLSGAQGTALAPQVVATFTSSALGAQAANFTAAIDWGDGSITPGIVRAAAAGGGFEVVAAHTFSTSGTLTVRVVVSDGSGLVSTGLTTASVAPPGAPRQLVVALAPFNHTGSAGRSMNVTNFSSPTFLGFGQPLALVQVTAQRLGTWPTEALNLGSAIVDPFGNWTLTAPFMPDGAYLVTATQTPSAGFVTPPATLSSPLVIDTTGPRVAALQFNPRAKMITVVLSDAGVGVDPMAAMNPNAYTIVGPGTITGTYAPGVTTHPAIAGFYSQATSATVSLAFGSSAPLPRGRYLFQILSSAMTDMAGNPLDGEFMGQFPSGNGAVGGNFIARLMNNEKLQSPGPRMRPVARHRGRH